MELMVIRAKESSRVCVGRGNVNGIKKDIRRRSHAGCVGRGV